MIRFRMKERIADLEFHQKRHITLEAIATKTKIHRTTLSRIASKPGFITTTKNIDKLCEYFGCSVGDLMEYVPTTPSISTVGEKQAEDGASTTSA